MAASVIDKSCSTTDFYIPDMGVASLSSEGNMKIDDAIRISPIHDYEYMDPDMMFDIVERYMLLPFLEETMDPCTISDVESNKEAMLDSDDDDALLHFAIQQARLFDEKTDTSCHSGDGDELECFDPQLFIRNLPDLSEVAPSLWPILLPRQARKWHPVTLVLDLDETLVHSTLEHCDDANFTFSVYFNLKEHTVYVRQRPHLHIFLERAAEMFELVVFTASESIYAEQLLNVLDPDQKLISQRIYRESCIFSDGGYVKDLTILGRDLAKVVIVDNSPQVFRLQVNNGIPIPSWFDDPSDSELLSMLPFLETLVVADDVRPIIAKRFGVQE